MANYPQIDDCSGVWKLKDVNDAVMGGYWRVGGTRALFGGGNQGDSNVIDFITIVSTGDAADFGDLTTGGEAAGGFGSPNDVEMKEASQASQSVVHGRC